MYSKQKTQETTKNTIVKTPKVYKKTSFYILIGGNQENPTELLARFVDIVGTNCEEHSKNTICKT